MFKSGPTGRRAALATGPNVWEIIAAARAIAAEIPTADDERLIAELAYHRAWPREVDDRIVASERAATELGVN